MTGGRKSCKGESSRGGCKTDGDRSRGREEEGLGGLGGHTKWCPGHRLLVSLFSVLSALSFLLNDNPRCIRCAKARSACELDLEKPKQCACKRCAALKEKCKQLEVGSGSRTDKGKGKVKEAATSPQGGEKRKKKTVAQVAEVAGPSRSKIRGKGAPKARVAAGVVVSPSGQVGQQLDLTGLLDGKGTGIGGKVQ